MLRAFMLLADAARAHDDHTFSLLRGGIDRFTYEGAKGVLRCALILRVSGEPADAGMHAIEIRFALEGGKATSLATKELPIRPEGSNAQIIADMAIEVANEGLYVFEAVVDGVVLTSLRVNVRSKGAATAAKAL